MSGFPRPDWNGNPNRVSPINRLRRLRPRARPRFKGPSFNRMIPNLMTLLGLCAGLTSMRFALEGRFGSAAVAIVVAGAIDGLDGRLARLLKATSRFGAEFDSLADFLCFGVAPAFIAVPLVAATRRRLRLHALPDVRGLHGAAAGALQRRARPGAWPGLRLQLLHRRSRAGRRRACPVPAVPRAGGEVVRAGLAAGCGAVPAVLRVRPDRDRAAAGVHLAGLELQELQGAA